METKMTRQELLDFLANWSYGAQAVTVVAETPQASKMNKAGKTAFPNLKKHSVTNGMIGYDYSSSVNRQREREGKEKDFYSLPLWNGRGERVSKALARLKGKEQYYLTLKVEKVISSYFFDADTMRQIDKNELNGMFYAKSSSSRQGVDKVIVPNEIKLENIRELHWFGVVTEITD